MCAFALGCAFVLLSLAWALVRGYRWVVTGY